MNLASAPGPPLPEGSAITLFLTFQGFYRLVSGTQSTGREMLSFLYQSTLPLALEQH